MNNTVILTIAIPTYNRPFQIQKQVRNIIPQLTDNIVLKIYDNCSNVVVETLFSDEEKKHVKIVRHNTNIGGDANIARCFEECETRWLWTLSDDDYVKSDALSKVMLYIKKNDDCVFLNCLSKKQCKTENFIEFAEIMSNADMFGSSFAMSACLYNMNLLKDDLYFYYKYLSSKIGTIIMVSKNIQRTNNKSFLFRDMYIDLGEDVGWNYADYIFFSSLIYNAFKKDNSNRHLEKNLLLGYSDLNYWLIKTNRKSSHISDFERLMLLVNSIKRQGLINAFHYSFINISKAFISIIFGDKVKTYLIKHLRR